MKIMPVACSLDAEALKARRDGLLGELLRRAALHVELPNGYRFQFTADDDIIALIAQVIDAERRCCRFLRFQLTVEPDGGPIDLDLTGPPSTREFVESLLL